jgi:hypothetical protein
MTVERGIISPIDRYELMYHRVKIRTGNFISVALSFWIGENTYDVRAVLTDGEEARLPGILMGKIESTYHDIYLQMNYHYEINRIRKEVDKTFFQRKN